MDDIRSINEFYYKIELTNHSEIFKETCKYYGEINKKYVAEIRKIEQLLEDKKNNPYKKIEYDFELIRETIVELDNCVKKLNDEVRIFNEKIEDNDKYKEEAIALNKKIAAYSNSELFKEYDVKKIEYEECKKKNQEFKDKLDEKKRELKNIQSLKKNVEIAIKKINEYLDYIFFEKDRLGVELDKNKYVVKSRGRNIAPKQLSTGERNVLALCYFVSSLFKDKNDNIEQNEPIFVVLDDPISSFDNNNKIGVFSFLRFVIETFLKNKSKILVLTHELQTIYNFSKTFEDIDSKNFVCKELKNGFSRLAEFSPQKYNIYSNILWKLYKFAFEAASLDEECIGNYVRQVFEAFGTFNYGLGISELSTHKTILECFDDENEKVYFRNLMYRLVLNGESHLKVETNGLIEQDFFPRIDTDEKIKVVKHLLYFLHKINKNHLHMMLAKNKVGIDEIESYMKECKKNIQSKVDENDV